MKNELVAVQLLGEGTKPQLMRRTNIRIRPMPLGHMRAYRDAVIMVLGNEKEVKKELETWLAHAKSIAPEIGITPKRYLAQYHPIAYNRLLNAIALFEGV